MLSIPTKTLNAKGREVFRVDLYAMAFGKTKFIRNHDQLLHDPRYHETDPKYFLPMVNPTQQFGGTMGKCGEYLFSVFGMKGMTMEPGAWDYLTLIYWDQIAQPLEGGGFRLSKIKAKGESDSASSPISKYRFDDDDRRRAYRHRMHAAYVIYTRFRNMVDKAQLLFTAPLTQHSDEFEQIFDRRELLANPVLIEVANLLYFDPQTGKIRQRVKGQRLKAAALRRYTTLMNEFAETFNFREMNAMQVLALLPEDEFGGLLKLALNPSELKQVVAFRTDIASL